MNEKTNAGGAGSTSPCSGSISKLSKYPDYELIENLSRKYSSLSIDSLTKDETIDLINHLREAVRELKSNADLTGKQKPEKEPPK